MRAQYLLRFDDICPSMNWRVWNGIERVLRDQGIKPILAVIPDNRDEELRISCPDDHFWDRVRQWQSWGWTIAMHGWQHCYVTNHSGVLGVNNYSEFAGLSRHEQEYKLECGQKVFEREGIASSIWIAPAHSFDAVTIDALSRLRFRYISDGFSSLPHVDDHGIMWIPQQLWDFRWRFFGVWTICFHINRWTDNDIVNFKKRAAQYRLVISNFNTIVDRYNKRQKTRTDQMTARMYRSAAQTKAAVTQRIRSFIQNATLPS
jgi:predicted deacetylase